LLPLRHIKTQAIIVDYCLLLIDDAAMPAMIRYITAAMICWRDTLAAATRAQR